MPTPICFMVMPYRTRDTQTSPPAPSRVDFDALWEKALRPAVAGLGYRPVRADQDLGPLIIKEMLERLYFSDLVIADLTISNGNVYYEVGIRHAAKDSGCVLISADWAKPLFDVDQMRQIRYALPEGQVTDATAAAIRETLTQSIPALAGSGSPMYETLEGYPTNVRADRARAMSEFLDELAAFQEASRRVAVLPKAEQAGSAREVRDHYGTKRPIVAAVAMEVVYLLRDYAGFEDALAFLDTLPVSVQRLPAMREQRSLALSKSGDHPTAIAALKELIAMVGPTAERYGLLGGRYKKLADAGTPGERARALDQAIDAYERGMQTDLNDYYPSSNLPRLYRRRGRAGDDERARRAAAVAMTACDRAKRLFPNDEWVRPTLLGMAFDAADASMAEELADQVALEGAARWKLDTTLEDLRRALDLTSNADTRARLQAVVTRLEQL